MIAERLSERGIQVKDVSEIVRSVDLKMIRVSESGESEEKGQTIGVAISLVILLYMSLMIYGIITMRSVLEEKTTRTMEVLISSVRQNPRRSRYGLHTIRDLDWFAGTALVLLYCDGEDGAGILLLGSSSTHLLARLHGSLFCGWLFSLLLHVCRDWGRLFERTRRSSIAMARHGSASFLHVYLRLSS